MDINITLLESTAFDALLGHLNSKLVVSCWTLKTASMRRIPQFVVHPHFTIFSEKSYTGKITLNSHFSDFVMLC